MLLRIGAHLGIWTFATAAGIVEDHSLSWGAAGLTDELAVAYKNALPPALFEAVAAAAPLIQHESTESLKFGKHTTWWLPLRAAGTVGTRLPQAHSAIEAAIHALYELDFGSSPTLIVGAEWWLQERAPEENIGYHYDKDEAYASEHMTMRFPEVSTVTYLGDGGAPTLVFNQTTPDGNKEVPPLPNEALLVYPQPNKHFAFRGNLQHGVSGDLQLSPSGSGGSADDSGKRRTLLINWWRSAPMPPNCVPFPTERWEKLKLRLDAGAMASLRFGKGMGGGLSMKSVPQTTPFEPLSIDRAASRWTYVEVAPTDQLYFSFPQAAEMRTGNWLVRWARGEAVGPIARMDLYHTRSLNAMFNDPRPKLILLLPSRAWREKPPPGRVTHWAESLPKWLHALHEARGASFKFVLSEPRETANFMKQFGLTMADVPTAVIHDTSKGGVGGPKYVLREKLRKASIWRFVDDFLAERLKKEEL